MYFLKSFFRKRVVLPERGTIKYEVEWDATLEPWLERTDDVLAGWTFDISVQQKYDYNRCVIPMTTFANGITWEELAELWRLEAQKWSEIKKNN